MNRLMKVAIWSTTCVAALGVTGTAFAQEAAESDPTRLDEIVVTAQKRTENLRNVPISITAITSEDLDARGLRNVRDLQFAIPNVTTYTIGNFSPNIIIRGIGSSARNIGFESSLGVYVDGVYQGRSDATTQELEDIAQVEVLRGPQGTLFGKNTTSGAINISTKRPTNDTEGSVAIGYGNFNAYRASALISGALAQDKVFAKLSFFAAGRDGFVENLNSTGPKDFDNDRATGMRTEFRFEPSERFTLTLRSDWSKNKYRDYEVEIAEVPPGGNAFGIPEDSVAPGIRTVNVDGNSDGRRKIYGTSATAEYEVGNYTLTSITAYRKLESALNLDLDGTSSDYLTSEYSDNSSHFTQEIRIASPSDARLKYVIGGYYFNQKASSVRDINIGQGTQDILEFGLGLPSFLLDPPVISTITSTRTKSWAGFANASFDITDQLSLLGGIRVTKETKKLNLAQISAGVFAFPGVVGPDPIFINVDPSTDRLSQTDVSPTAGLSYKLSDAATIYARWSKGFKSGGWNSELIPPNTDPAIDPDYFNVRNIRFESESIQNYEVGAKADLLDRKLRVNAALFWTVYKDIQIAQFIGGLQGFRTDNAGSARSRGFELELSARPVDGLDLSANVGYADAKYTRYDDACGAGCSLAGTRLDAPVWTAGGAAQYAAPLSGTLDLVLRVDYAYRSSRAGTGTVTERLDNSLPAVSTFDTRIALAFDNGLNLSVWARNLFNKNYFVERGFSTNAAIIGLTQRNAEYAPPRTYGVRASYKF